MSNIHVLPGFDKGRFRIALSDETSYADVHEVIWALAQSGQTTVRFLQVFPDIPALGHCTTTAPLELTFPDRTWELCYGMNTERNVASDFEPVRTVEIDDVVHSAWKEKYGEPALGSLFYSDAEWSAILEVASETNRSLWLAELRSQLPEKFTAQCVLMDDGRPAFLVGPFGESGDWRCPIDLTADDPVGSAIISVCGMFGC